MPTSHGYNVQRAVINTASSGNTTLVAAVSGYQIVVTNLFLISAGTVTVTFQSGAGGTAITGGCQLTAQTGFVLPDTDDKGWFETASGSLLNLNLNAAIQVSGSLSYFLKSTAVF